jgi:hypothetical protein
MKFWFVAVVIGLLSISVSGLAQQNNTFRVKRSTPEKPPKSTVSGGKTASSARASTANSKELQNLEHQTAKSSAPPRSAGKRTAPALKPVKDKPNPPINFGGSGGGKGTGSTKRGSSTLAGRLKQKGSHQ